MWTLIMVKVFYMAKISETLSLFRLIRCWAIILKDPHCKLPYAAKRGEKHIPFPTFGMSTDIICQIWTSPLKPSKTPFELEIWTLLNLVVCFKELITFFVWGLVHRYVSWLVFANEH